MHISIATLEAHAALVWVLFLAPVFFSMHRGYVLETRARRLGLPVQYGAAVLLGFMPLVGIAAAAYCTAQSLREFRR